MGKVICVGNQKGGVGKTTTCVNLGTALPQAGERVCLIDLDPQGNLTQSLGYRNPDEMECTIAEVLKSEIQLCDNLSQSSSSGFGRYQNSDESAWVENKDTDDPELHDNLSRSLKRAILHHREGMDLMSTQDRPRQPGEPRTPTKNMNRKVRTGQSQTGRISTSR